MMHFDFYTSNMLAGLYDALMSRLIHSSSVCVCVCVY